MSSVSKTGLTLDEIISRLQQFCTLRKANWKKGAAGQGLLFHAPHRPDKKPSFSIFLTRHGVPWVHDFATGMSKSLYEFCLEDLHLSREDARYVVGLPPLETGHKRRKRLAVEELARKNFEEQVRALQLVPSPAPERAKELADAIRPIWEACAARKEPRDYLLSRGFEGAPNLGLREDGSIAIPVGDWVDGEFVVLNVKYRIANPSPSGGRYLYAQSGVGGYLYYAHIPESPGLVVLVEGELNAAAGALALPQHAWIGLPGSSAKITTGLMEFIRQTNAPVAIFADPDAPGRKLIENLKAQLYLAGFSMDMIIIPCEDKYQRQGKYLDFADRLARFGKDKLAEHISDRLLKGCTVQKRTYPAAPRRAAVVHRDDSIRRLEEEFPEVDGHTLFSRRHSACPLLVLRFQAILNAIRKVLGEGAAKAFERAAVAEPRAIAIACSLFFTRRYLSLIPRYKNHYPFIVRSRGEHGGKFWTISVEELLRWAKEFMAFIVALAFSAGWSHQIYLEHTAERERFAPILAFFLSPPPVDRASLLTSPGG